MATSKLQRYISNHLSIWIGGLTIKENHRPEWLVSERGERLELDFYIEELESAIEVQGEQHYQFVKHFHIDYAGFQDQKRRDKVKRAICAERGIRLYQVFDLTSADTCMEHIIAKHNGLDSAPSTEKGFSPIPSKQIRKLVATIIAHHTHMPELAKNASMELEKLADGCNPDAFNTCVRRAVKGINPRLNWRSLM